MSTVYPWWHVEVTAETAAQKARLAEDGWNSRDPGRVVLACTRGQPLAEPRRGRPGAPRSSPSCGAGGD
ncbi:DUF1348 family protein [Azospirillum sp. ST 5-10]|uniref:DUF1348 family protein n=1 Tax=unclassified Azospirillum TaxID=2630922 RepID=UPI003F4A462F